VVCPHGHGRREEVEPVETIFCDFVQTSFMDGPLQVIKKESLVKLNRKVNLYCRYWGKLLNKESWGKLLCDQKIKFCSFRYMNTCSKNDVSFVFQKCFVL